MITALESQHIVSPIRRLKICHLSKYYPPVPGGIETHVQSLARSQAELGHDVSVLCSSSKEFHKSQNLSGCNTIEVDKGVCVIRFRCLLSIAKLDLSLDLLKYLWTVATSKEYDIVHIHTPNPTMILGWYLVCFFASFRKLGTASLVVTHHSDIIKQRFRKFLLYPFKKFVYEKAVYILATSPNYLDGSNLLSIFHSKVKVLSLGLDLQLYLNPTPASVAYRSYLEHKYGDQIWLCVGRLIYYKGIHMALEALTKVPGKLLIIGTGKLEKKLKEKSTQLGVSERVVWLGHVDQDQLAGAYQAATAFWFPSNARSEGFGLVQVEAMASTCPVINTHIPGSGVSWVSRHQQEGFTVGIGDAEALAKAASQLLEDKELRNHLAESARRRACKEFEQMRMAEQSLEIYRNVLGQPHDLVMPLKAKEGVSA
ncbi:glycosyltransferase [Leptothoe sp. LEGE 181152]|nr:glycosyltransferase [Leptothoe sp. LEGE 181152]